MFEKILIANRGEIACRVIRSARRMNIRTVAVYSDADADALHVRMADEALRIGPAAATESYISIERVLEAVRASGADAVHPGYGFLSERADFARALEAERVAFIGPPVGAIEAMGDKITSKKLAAEAGVSTVPGHMGLIEDAEHAARIAGEIGYPVMIKASAGGGGKGMRIAWDPAEAREGFARSRSEAASSFGDDRIFIEKFVSQPRHIEIQVLGDTHGTCLYLGERECSIQRRNQKVIEEAPSPFLDAETRRAMGEQAVALAKAVEYASAGTVEFIVDAARNFYFLEMNTRLQVEHPVTELVTGIDLVEQMIRVAAGEKLAFGHEDVRLDGWAIESRLYAEDPYRNFRPSTGRLTRYRPPQEHRSDAQAVRNDTGVYEGGEISIFYDPMIAKLCTWAPDRPAAIEAMRGALDAFELEGIGHNLPFLSAVMDHPRFVAGEITTAFIAEEWPEGFHGVDLPEAVLRDLAAFAIALHDQGERRASRVSGALPSHERTPGDAWVVRIGERSWRGEIAEREGAYLIALDGEARLRVAIRQGDFVTALVNAEVDGRALAVKVDRCPGGYRMRYRGADLGISVLAPRHAELAALMPVREPPDTSRLLICPMPGTLMRLDVGEGDAVEAGQALCMVEAMKMENVLRAERSGRVAKVNARPGDSLGVDEVILEFD